MFFYNNKLIITGKWSKCVIKIHIAIKNIWSWKTKALIRDKIQEILANVKHKVSLKFYYFLKLNEPNMYKALAFKTIRTKIQLYFLIYDLFGRPTAQN